MICVSSVRVYPSNMSIKVGEWNYDAYAAICPTDATNQSVTWHSSNTSVASVNETTGYIYGVSKGTAKIYATAEDGSCASDYCTVTVSDKVGVSYITLTPSCRTLPKGDHYVLSAMVYPTNATNKNLEWYSSNPEIVSVDNDGVVTAEEYGSATISVYASDNYCAMATCCITVTPDKLVETVTVTPSSKSMTVGESAYLFETVCPEDATNRYVNWTSSNKNVAKVNDVSGLVYAQGEGTAIITATALDGGGASDYCTVTVKPVIPVESISICPTSLTMNVNDIEYLCTSIFPSIATNKDVIWCSSNEDVATVGLHTGKISALKAGTTIITATTVDGGYSASCEVWVRGKTPVFLIHGRTSNSKGVWGVNNNIPSGKNDEFKSDLNAEALNGKKYIDVTSQEINDYEPNEGATENPRNLGIELQNSGYNGNLNLFVFNYPNEDAVKYSAEKFEAYINNLISYVRTSGSDAMKACFYASRNDFNNNNYKINIVGHSMGGLVARYFIENLYQDNHVDKLITICTPHWGSGLANVSGGTGEIIEDLHVLADHDLDLGSAMFGGNNSINLNCNAGLNLNPCYTGDYVLTDALQYNRQRSTKYYAIAGIDYPSGMSNYNDFTFEMPTNFTTMQQIVDYFTEKGIKSFSSTNMSIIEINPKSVGDNMVGFLSQIGWIGDNNVNTPAPRIQMEKIFVDVDTDGGNSILSRLHSKIPHRTCIVQKVYSYLNE